MIVLIKNFLPKEGDHTKWYDSPTLLYPEGGGSAVRLVVTSDGVEDPPLAARESKDTPPTRLGVHGWHRNFLPPNELQEPPLLHVGFLLVRPNIRICRLRNR